MTTKEQCEMLYKSAFGESPEFDKMLFDLFFENIEVLKIGDEVAAMYFKIPCFLILDNTRIKADYIYAVTTADKYRRKGLMSKLFADTQTDTDTVYFLKPSSEGVIAFYEQVGFKKIIGTRAQSNATIEVNDNFKKLSALCDKPQNEYPIMIKGNADIDRLTFEYTLE